MDAIPPANPSNKENQERPPNPDRSEPEALVPATDAAESGSRDAEDPNGVRDPSREGETIDESTGDSGEPVYNVSIVEANDPEADPVQHNVTLWSVAEDASIVDANFCSFEIDIPAKYLTEFCMSPCLHVDKVAKAAKKNHVEVQYKTLSPSERKEFDQAKIKELGCWIETSSIEPILRD